MKTTYTNGNKTIELTEVSPAHEKALKDNGFSYAKARKVWYALNTPKRREFVEGLVNENNYKNIGTILGWFLFKKFDEIIKKFNIKFKRPNDKPFSAGLLLHGFKNYVSHLGYIHIDYDHKIKVNPEFYYFKDKDSQLNFEKYILDYYIQPIANNTFDRKELIKQILQYVNFDKVKRHYENELETNIPNDVLLIYKTRAIALLKLGKGKMMMISK